MLPDVSILCAKPLLLFQNTTTKLLKSPFPFYIMFCGGDTTLCLEGMVQKYLQATSHLKNLLQTEDFLKCLVVKKPQIRNGLLKHSSNVMVNSNS